ncbi:MAG: flagellar hook protein FlgE [Acidobacteriota bacterium]|nr:MAG: flagellar hook protein FlgE [Acidobacteriota bacterium]
MQTATLDLRYQVHRLAETAERLAREAPTGHLAGDLVDLHVGRQAVHANVAVLRTADEMVGTLLDVLA